MNAIQIIGKSEAGSCLPIRNRFAKRTKKDSTIPVKIPFNSNDEIYDPTLF